MSKAQLDSGGDVTWIASPYLHCELRGESGMRKIWYRFPYYDTIYDRFCFYQNMKVDIFYFSTTIFWAFFISYFDINRKSRFCIIVLFPSIFIPSWVLKRPAHIQSHQNQFPIAPHPAPPITPTQKKNPKIQK
jgi:hypothetical protein